MNTNFIYYIEIGLKIAFDFNNSENININSTMI